MSSILLLLEDGEMHPFVPGAGTGSIVLTRGGVGGAGGSSSLGGATDGVLVGTEEAALGLGSHFLTHDPTADRVTNALDAGGMVTKVEVDNMATMSVPIEVVVEKSLPGPSASTVTPVRSKKSNSGEKRVCLWPQPDGTTCGKTFAKYDSLKKHLTENHKAPASGNNVHLKGKNQSTANIQVVQVQPPSQGQFKGVLSSPGAANPSLSTPLHMPNPLPFLNLNGSLPTSSKPLGSKVCRWVQNDGTVCGKAFSKLDSLRRHVNELHKGVRPYSCDLCDKCYGRRDYLDRHIRTHNRKPKPSPTSGDSSLEWGPSGVLLQGDEAPAPPPPKVPKKKRKDIPPEEKKICLWVMEDGKACGKTFTKFDSLKRHVSEAHKGIRPYTCSLCGKSYGRRDYLLRHLKSHNEAEVANLNISKVSANPVQHHLNDASPDSGSGLLGSSSINFHSLVPAAPPPPPPSLSGILASPGGNGPATVTQIGHHHQAPSLPPIKTAQNAKKRAAEDKKTCKWVLENGTVCGRTFSKFDSLRRHVKELHKGIRPFMCQLCEKTYGRKDYLDRHLKSHEDGSLDDEVDGDHAPSLNDSLITAMKTDGDGTTVGIPGEEVILSNVVTVVSGSNTDVV